MGGRTKKNGGRLGPRPSVQETQTTPSARSVAPTNPPQKVSGDRASSKKRSQKRAKDNQSEDEDAVEGMMIDTEQERSASRDSDEQENGPGGVESGPDTARGSNPNNEKPVLSKTDSPRSQTEKPTSRVASPPIVAPESLGPRIPSDRPKTLLSHEEVTSQVPGSGTNSKRASKSSRSKTSGPIPISPIPVRIGPAGPLPKATPSVSPPSKGKDPVVPLPRPSPPNDTAVPQESPSSTDLQNPTGPCGVTSSPGKVVQGGPPGPAGTKSDPKHDDIVTAEAQSTAQVAEPQLAEPQPDRNGTHTESGNLPEDPPEESQPAPSYKSDIESLYASSSPEKTAMEIEPIELDSDPDFEKMEQMLFSHRGPLSQSQPVRKESTVQSPTPRSLKRQRSHPSLSLCSQTATQEPRAGSKPAKRPRVKGSHPSDSGVTLNDRKKHPDFWDLDGTVVLQVDDTLFRVMRSTLSKASPWFQRLFSEDLDHLEVMAGCPVYLIEEDLSHLDFANLLRGLENGLEYALNPPHYLRIVSIFRAASLLEFNTLRRWSLGCLEKQWPAELPPPSKPSKFGDMIPWAEETLAVANQLDVPQLAKRAYWELCTRPEFGRIDAEVYDDEVEDIMPTRSRLPRSVMMDLTRLRERLLPEWTRVTRSPPVDVSCPRATTTPSPLAIQPAPCSLDYASWYKVILEVEVNDMTIDDRRMDLISTLEVMVVEIDWEKEGGFCADCVRAWKTIWTKDREKIWKNLGDWLELDDASET